MNAPFEVRRLKKGELSEFRRLRLAGLREFPSAFAEDAEAFEARPETEISRRIEESENDGGFIASAWVGEKLIGICGVRRLPHAKLRHRADIWGVYVDPAYRGYGTGRGLLEFVMRETPSDVTQFKLSVTTTNSAALHLYLRLGFRIVGLDPSVLKIGEASFDEYEMVYDREAGNRRSGNSNSETVFRELEASDVQGLGETFANAGDLNSVAQFERYLEEQSKGLRSVLIAQSGGKVAGYVTISWMRYPSEIQDLRVHPDFRRRGVATGLLENLEDLAKRKTGVVTLEVGLTAEFAAAQRLYAKRGYIPDGDGLKYGERLVEYGEYIKADENLTLRLSKLLG